MIERLPVHTIGHSTLAIDVFITRLAEAGIEQLIDVRALPGSRAHPQFDQDALRASLAAHGIDYRHMTDLGGRRGRQPGIPAQANGGWDNISFHHYADWALQPPFRAALAQLRALGQRRRCALMCAESLWWRCHRRIIADHLLAAGESVRHIMTAGIVDARLTPAARISSDGIVTYPATP